MKKILLLLVLLFIVQFQIEGREIVKNILIVYGSERGSTKEVAEKMKGYLEEKGCNIEVQTADNKKKDFSKYDLIIIGSGIYGGKPHKDVSAFVKINTPELEKKKLAVFAMSGFAASKRESKRKKALEFPKKIAGNLSTTHSAVFAGKIPSSGKFLDFLGKLLFGMEVGDYRDWDKIKAWTLSLIE